MKTPLQEAQWAAYEAITLRREQDAGKDSASREHRARLLEEAAQWTTSQQIRGYVAMVLERAGQPSSPQVDVWATWALGIAQSTDPVAGRIADLLSPTNEKNRHG